MRQHPFLIPIWNWFQWLLSGWRLMAIGIVLLTLMLLGRVLLRLPFVASIGSGNPNIPGTSESKTRDRSTQVIQVGEQVLNVEVVQTPADIEQGLSDRSEIGSDGMLFLLPRRSAPSFWMLRMKFALDMIWLDNGKIVQIDTDVPPPSETNGVPTVVTPRQPVTAVLEVPAGMADQYNWQVGMTWSLE